MGEYLFVYGTLRSDLASAETRSLLTGVKRVSAATVRGKLYDLGGYPGLILDRDGELIVGEVLELSEAKTQFRAFDEYEGFTENAVSQSLFVRTKCRAVFPGGQFIEAWIYIYNQALTAARLVESGNYAEVAQRLLQSEISN